MTFYRLAESDPTGGVLVLVPPQAPTFPESGSGPATPLLTTDMIAAMRTLPGAGPTDSAALIAANQQTIAREAAALARSNSPDVVVFGPFAEKPRP
ncbi:MAG: hypothetical protein JWM33_2951 [Caulobacteraceae bacterium]|nr:hypothetical protein [Caulobacteraceae bacterium]